MREPCTAEQIASYPSWPLKLPAAKAARLLQCGHRCRRRGWHGAACRRRCRCLPPVAREQPSGHSAHPHAWWCGTEQRKGTSKAGQTLGALASGGWAPTRRGAVYALLTE